MIVSLYDLLSAQPAAGLAIKAGALSIGRSAACDLVVHCPCVSRRHCLIRVDEDRAEVEDLESHNGTYVNGERVGRRELADGDFLCIGSRVFKIGIRQQTIPILARSHQTAPLIACPASI